MPEILTCKCGCQSWLVTEYHYECSTCGLKVEPRMMTDIEELQNEINNKTE